MKKSKVNLSKTNWLKAKNYGGIMKKEDYNLIKIERYFIKTVILWIISSVVIKVLQFNDFQIILRNLERHPEIVAVIMFTVTLPELLSKNKERRVMFPLTHKQ